MVLRLLRAGLLPLALAAAVAASIAATTGGAPAIPSSPSAACGGRPARPGDAELAIVSRGVRRTARVHVPRALSADASLLLAFHGTGGSGRFMEGYSGLVAQLERSGAIGVFPDADGPRWNVEESPRAADDVDFVRDLIAVVGRRYCVDLDRVSAAGVSNGGSMAALLACAMPRRLAGVAIVAGGFATLPPCRSRRAVSILEIHGLDDPVAPYAGSPANAHRGSVLAWLRGWARRDGCRAAVPRRRVVALRTVRFDWGRCRGGTTVTHLAIAGGMHQWPGAVPPDRGPVATISAAAQVWGFLAGRRLPG